MILVSDPAAPNWGPFHAAEWSQFLSTETGKALLAVIAYGRLDPLDVSKPEHSRAARADQIAGYESAVSLLLALKRPIEAPKATERDGGYPDLDAPAE